MHYYKSEVHPSRVISRYIFVIFLVVSSILPLFSFDGYSIFSNTTSHLGAQASPHAWIMNVVFIVLGVQSIYLLRKHPLVAIRVLGMVFGLSLIFAGIFRHAPLLPGIQANSISDSLHSVFATTTGISFSALALTAFITDKSKHRWIPLLLVFIATGEPFLMMILPSWMGIIQRVMFISAFMWIFFGAISIQFDRK